MKIQDWFKEVVELASKLGYSQKQVEIFKSDLIDHYNDGKTPEEAVDIEF